MFDLNVLNNLKINFKTQKKHLKKIMAIVIKNSSFSKKLFFKLKLKFYGLKKIKVELIWSKIKFTA